MAKEPQPKRNVYVGGLEEQVNEEILHAAFVPFGDVVEVNTTPYNCATPVIYSGTHSSWYTFIVLHRTDTGPVLWYKRQLHRVHERHIFAREEDP